MDLPSFKASYGKTTLASNHFLSQKPVLFNWKWNSRTINAPISNSLLFTNPKDSVKNQMVFLVSHLIKKWPKRSFITFGHSKTMESLITPWLVSVLLLRKWVKPHTLYSEATTQLKLLEVLPDLNHSKTSQIGLVHGLLRDKEWTMVVNPCKNQVRTLVIQLSLILEVPNSLFLQMFSRRSENNGKRMSQNLTANQTKLSATSKNHAKKLPQKLNQLDSKWVITFLKLTQNNIYTRVTKVNASSLYTNANSQERTLTFSLLVTPF